MNDSERTRDSPDSAASAGSFEISVTEEFLQQACDNTCPIHGTQQLRTRYRAFEGILGRQRKHRSPSTIWLVVLLNVAALTVSIVFFSQGDATGGFFWGALFLLIFLALLTVLFNKQIVRGLVTLQKRRLRTEAGKNQRSAESMFETYKDQTPYTAAYQLGQKAWSSDSQPGGHKEVELNSDMFVLHNGSSYILYESEFSSNALFVIATQTGEQRSLVEANPAANGIPCHHIDEFDLDLDQLAQ